MVQWLLDLRFAMILSLKWSFMFHLRSPWTHDGWAPDLNMLSPQCWLRLIVGLGLILLTPRETLAAVDKFVPPAARIDLSTQHHIEFESGMAQRSFQKPTAAFIIVNSSAVGAQVFINGIYVGEVNRRIPVMPGIRRLEVTHKDYLAKSIEVRILRGKTHQIRIELDQKTSAAPLATPATPRQSGQYQKGTVQAMRQQPGLKRKKPLRKKKRRRKPPQASPELYKAPAPQPRSAGSYALSFLPFGLPQLVQKKPALGGAFFLTQAGGIGVFIYYYFYYYNSYEKTRQDYLDKLDQAIKKQRVGSSHHTTLSDEKTKYTEESENFLKQIRFYSYLGLGSFGLAYLASAVEALVVGPPPPKSPLESILSVKRFECRSCQLTMALDYQTTKEAAIWQQVVASSDLALGFLSPHPVTTAPTFGLNWTYSL